jgi:hypothetical protein
MLLLCYDIMIFAPLILVVVAILCRQVHASSITDTLASSLVNTLGDGPLQSGLSGYRGWNYECATVIYAIEWDMKLTSSQVFGNDAIATVDDFLDEATQFPQLGYRISTAAWLFSPGDRVGLFGGLYNIRMPERLIARADEIVYAVRTRLPLWQKKKGCFVRNIGWGPLYGFRLRKVWIWADDAFIGGFSLVYSDPVQLGQIILDYDLVLRDPNDNLWWHGALIKWNGSLVYNGVKWSRANGWMLLACSTFLLETRGDEQEGLSAIRSQISSLLTTQLTNLVNYQRETGAFGNVVNNDDSPDETSLTSTFVFSVGATVLLDMDPPPSSVIDAAEKAWIWINGRTVSNLTVSDTCGSQNLANRVKDYDKNVGSVAGPGLALILWASLGAELLDLVPI